MMNRLRCLMLPALLFLILIFSHTTTNAQCPDSTTNHWIVTLNDPAFWSSTIYIGANCDDTLAIPDMGFLPPTGATPSPFGEDMATISPGSFSFGDTIGGNQVINLTYHLAADSMGFARNDTVCIELIFLDTVPPTVSVLDDPLAALPMDIMISCPDNYPDTVHLVAIDNCNPIADTLEMMDSQVPVPAMYCPMGGALISRVWTANNGDTLHSQLITIIPDTSPPTVSMMPTSDTVSCIDADFNAWLAVQDSIVMNNISDDCSLITPTQSITQSDALNTNCNTWMVDYFLADSCGNADTLSIEYMVLDTIDPILLGLPMEDTLMLNCGDPVPSAPTVTATDTCDPLVIPVNFNETTTSSCIHSQTIVRTWDATDNCGNMTSFVHTIIQEDIDGPTFTIPPDITINCNADTSITNTGDITNLMDNCTNINDILISRVDSVHTGFCMTTTKDTIYRTWTVEDLCGNITSQTQTIIVRDNSAPSMFIPFNITISCHESADTSVTGSPTMISDNCDSNPLVTFSDTTIPGGCPNNFTIERLWRIEDACGNFLTSTQIITIEDNTSPTFTISAQDMSIVCGDEADMVTAFDSWIAVRGNATATDNCSDADSLDWVAYNSGTMDMATLGLGGVICPGPGSNIYWSRTVDFIVMDECGNVDTSTATFNIIDNDPPTLTDCPGDIVLDTDPGICTTVVPLSLPIVEDGCGNMPFPDVFTLGAQFSIPFGSDPLETPIDDVVFNFSVPQPPYSASDNVVLKIDLVGVDGESATEFLNVVAEDGTILGQTNLTSDQCENSTTFVTITPAQFNDWAYDGILTITLEPNIPPNLPGRFAVNAICTDSAYATLDYLLISPNGLHFEYEINGGGRIDGGTGAGIASPTPTFDLGVNTVDYYFTDCAGNEATCSFTVTIEDNEPPEITCPMPLATTVGVDPGECEADVAIPLFTMVDDNCAVTVPFVQTQPSTPGEELLTFSFQPNLNDFLADDKEFVFTGITDFAAPGVVTLSIEILGDVDDPFEYFEIYDQDNNLLGITEIGQPNVLPGDSCMTPTFAFFDIPVTVFNNWINSSDSVSFYARTFLSIPVPPGGPDYGINPCDNAAVTMDGETDGVSRIRATLTYESIEVTLFGEGATDITPIVLEPPIIAPVFTLDEGLTTFTYEVTDLEGNLGECSFTIDVVDDELPSALCKTSVFIDISPSGFITDIIEPEDIDNGSFDNCGIESMSVSPNTVDCNTAGTFFTLTVIDSTGNTNTCQTFVSVEKIKPEPSILTDCGNDTLFLFSNPPDSPDAFTYMWQDQNGVNIGFTEDIIILDANEDNVGFYTVQITGVTGCTSTGVVQITCDDLPLRRPKLSVSNAEPCEEEAITLTTEEVCGTTILYKWYQGTAPGGTLLATTTVPEFELPNTFTSGIYDFYVEVERNGCSSEASLERTITVKLKPDAIPVATFDSTPLCEGGTITLSSPVLLGTTCLWTGPCGFTSTSCNPAPITDVTTCNSGTYVLVTTLDGCDSEPATLFINVNLRPEQPDITMNSAPANNPACVGDTVSLSATAVLGAISYKWFGPNGFEITTATSDLTINGVDLNHQGNWSVVAIGNPCESEPSETVEVFISIAPQGVTATASPNPICEGDELTLAAMSSSQDVSFNWTFPNGTMSAMQNPVIDEVKMTDEGTYTVAVTNPFGCRSIATVNVDVLENVHIAGVSAMVPNCASGLIDIPMFATPVTPMNDGTYTWHWVGPDNFTYTSSDSMAIILNANAQDNSGQYEVYVTNGSGCESEVATVDVEVPELIATPVTPSADKANPLCAGETVILETSEYTNSNVEYNWMTPLGILKTSTATIEIDDLTPAHTGNYSVSVMIDGCPSNQSGLMFLKVNAIPVINPTSNSPVCEGGILELSMTCDGDGYVWEGPGGFGVSNLCEPIVVSADPDQHAGAYKARKMIDGCWSEEVSIMVEIKPKPASGTAINFGPYCSDTEDVILAISPATAPANATFTWYEASSNTPLGSTTSLSFMVPGADLYGDDCVEFYAIADVDGCESLQSNVTVVCLNTLPTNQANAGDDQQICEDETLMLEATPPSVGTGRWSQASGINVVTISNTDSPNTTVTGLLPGASYTFQWCLSNGACEDYSCDLVNIVVDIIETAEAGDPIIVCNANSINLNAVMPATNQGMWTQSAGQAAIGIVIEDPTDPNTLVSNLEVDNEYTFTWQIDGGCGQSEDNVQVLVVAQAAYAGEDFEDCGDGCTLLSGDEPIVGGGIWTSPDPDVEILSPTDPNTTVCNLKEGDNRFIWTINGGACGSASIDEVIITYHYLPVAFDDQASVEFGGTNSINVTSNDQTTSSEYFINIIDEPDQGTIEFTPQGMITYTANINFIGNDIVQYELCTVDCSDCSTANVVFNVGADAECKIPSIITPNHDGMNDAFIIPCLANQALFPQNTISIFNQWGDEVFRASPYLNNWEGTFDGQDLPTGTYYYILTYENGQEPETGFFTLQR